MATLTVEDAARRLGVKPSKVRLLIKERRLSTYPAPGADQRGRDSLLLDADDVETLAQVRAHKRRPRETEADEEPAASSPPETPQDGPDEPSSLSGDVESSLVVDVSGHRFVALVQSMMTPLVAELRDARETIRRQAEELGALRAAVAEIESRARLAPAAAEPSSNGTMDVHAMSAPAGTGVPARILEQAAARTTAPRHLPVWRRALTYMRLS